MRGVTKSLLYFTLAGSLSSCLFSDGEIGKEIEYRRVERKASVLNPSVPSKLWEKLDAQYNIGSKMDEYSEGLDREKTNIDPPKKVYKTKVYLKEKTPGALDGYNYQIDFGSSGNLLDLKDFLSESRFGSFYIRFELDPLNLGPDGTSKGFRVFHLSNVKKLKIGGTVIGGGCNQYRDITSFFTKNNFNEGILVSAKSARHMSLLAGTFVFVAVDTETLYFTSLTITDSRFEKFLCRK